MHKDVIAGITTFNPDIDRLTHNIKSICKQVDKVLIVDNASSNIDEIVQLTQLFHNVVIVKHRENYGIAKSMNVVGLYAYNNGYACFLTLDQDSICPEDMIQQFMVYMTDDVGIICPFIRFNQSFISSLFHKKEDMIGKNRVEEVLYTISSGQLIKTKAWHSVGGFWEYLFIDYVDHEICLNFKFHGYRILRVNSCEMQHQPGIPILRFGISTAMQSAMREYYWARNSRLVYWLYKDLYKLYRKPKPFISTIKRFFNVLVVGKSVFKKLVAIFYGVVDAYTWKYKFRDGERYPFLVDNNRRY